MDDIKPPPKLVVEEDSPAGTGRQRSKKGTALLVLLIALLGLGLVGLINHKARQQSADLKAAEQRWKSHSVTEGQASIPDDLNINSLIVKAATVNGTVKVNGDVNIDGTLTVNGQPVTGVATTSGGTQTVITKTVIVGSGSGGSTSLPANVTLQGNTFNGDSQLVQLDGFGKLPALDGSALTNVAAVALNGQPGSFYQNASNLTSGTLDNSRLNSDVALLDRNSQVFTGNNQIFQNTSLTAFQIQNAGGASTLFVADTANMRVAIGKASASFPLDVAGNINSTTGFSVNGTAGITGSCSSSQLLSNATVKGGILTNGACTSSGGTSSLQGAYDGGNSITTSDGRDITFNLANTTTDSNFIINMLTGTTSKFQVQSNSTPVLSIGPDGAAAFQNSVDSTNAFQVQNHSSATPIFKVDTLNGIVGVGVSPSLGSGMLQIGGAVTISQFNPTTFTTPLGSGVSTQINIPVSSQGAFSQLIALGIDSGSADTARVLSVFDARTGPHQPSIGVLSPDQQNIAGISWEGNNGAVYLKTTGGGIGLRSGTTDLLTVSSTGQLGLSNNTRGYNVPIGNGANAVGVVFANAYPDANYAVLCTPTYNTTCYISSKSTTGFTLNLGTPAPDGNQALDWLVTR